MLRRLGLAVYRGFFWTYERGTWQYDVMVILILAFIFLTPRNWFHDKPLAAVSTTSDVVLLLDQKAQQIYQLRAALLESKAGSTADANLEESARRVLQSFTGKPLEITRIEPEVDSSGQVVSYAVWVRE
jgi:hypothetical protein